MYIQDLIITFNWWLYTLIIGLIFFPLTYRIFKKFTDYGWAFSRTVSILFLSYLTFVTSTLKVLSFSRVSLLGFLVVAIALNLYILTKDQKQLIKTVRKSSKYVLISEALFTAGLFFLAYVRAHQPDIRGLEKFMDFGFVNSALTTKFLPPTDMWAVGEVINYYWFGHFTTALLTMLTQIPSAIT